MTQSGSMDDGTYLDTMRFIKRQSDQAMTAHLSISVLTSDPGVSFPGHQGLSIHHAG